MKKCILIYDDDVETLTVTRIILEKKNYNVATRAQCDNIIQDINEIQPDLIFMDLWIPHIGGEDAVKLVKGNDAINHLPLILFSAIDSIEKITKDSGADGYLKKPFSIPDLLQLVENAISGKK